ncbi:MAG: protein kinase [Acidobacteriia bacterium]|nr:protein kinase [Terriglobia bacterium]
MSAQTVGRYEVIGELGRGAMGVVYKAQDPTIGRVVAMKTMRLDTHGLETEDMLRRFKNEARAAGLLSHPNIVTIFDAGEQDGMFYIAMEFIEGTTLHSMLADQRVLPPEEVIKIARQICRGLDYAHAGGIIHRDVKPANIMITARGMVKIMDFGIAKAGGGMTNTGQVLGTPNYMSPEQVKGKPLDGRSDLFSFGVMLYEMLTGEKPFIGQNVTTIIYKIVHENPIAPRDLDVTIHPGLSAVVTKALAKDPQDRYQSGAELIRDLENYKSIGSNLSATSVIPATSPSERTQALSKVTANGAGHAASKPAGRANAALNNLTHPHRRGLLEIALLVGLIVATAVVAYSYYQVRTARKLHEANVELERKIQEQQLQQAAAAKVLKQAEGVPDPTATVPADPTADSPADIGKTPQNTGRKSPNLSMVHHGELRFTSQPSGAKVEIDGWSDPRWVTPFKASNLAPGQHNITFSKPGYGQESRTSRVTENKSLLVSQALSSASTTLAVNSKPAGASILLDGKDTGKITPAQIVVSKGEHKVVLHKAGFREESLAATAEEGQTQNLSAAMQALPPLQMEENHPPMWRRVLGINDPIPAGKGLVRIRTYPEGATIQVGTQIAQWKTPVRWPVPPGTYQIVLKVDGYKTVTRTLHVQSDRAYDIDEIFEKQR